MQKNPLSKKELKEIVRFLPVKEFDLQNSNYMQRLGFLNSLFEFPAGLLLLLPLIYINNPVIGLVFIVTVFLIGQKLITAKHKVEKSIRAYKAIDEHFAQILEPSKE